MQNPKNWKACIQLSSQDRSNFKRPCNYLKASLRTWKPPCLAAPGLCAPSIINTLPMHTQSCPSAAWQPAGFACYCWPFYWALLCTSAQQPTHHPPAPLLALGPQVSSHVYLCTLNCMTPAPDYCSLNCPAVSTEPVPVSACVPVPLA